MDWLRAISMINEIVLQFARADKRTRTSHTLLCGFHYMLYATQNKQAASAAKTKKKRSKQYKHYTVNKSVYLFNVLRSTDWCLYMCVSMLDGDEQRRLCCSTNLYKTSHESFI